MKLAVRASLPAIVLFALCLAGCLKFPLGNAEKSQVDPKLQGYWMAQDNNNDAIVALYPVDQHVYVLETFEFAKGSNRQKIHDHQLYKAWITDVKGHPFLTLESLAQKLAPASEEMSYPVLRIYGEGDTRELRAVDADFEPLKSAKSAEEVAAIITREVDNPALYGESAMQYRRLDPERDADILKSLNLHQDE